MKLSRIRNPGGPVFDWNIPNPARIRRLRIQFDGPSGDSLDSRARLYALEGLGRYEKLVTRFKPL